MSCPCGTTHVMPPALRQIILEKGTHTHVATPDGAWRVPRAYIAFHGLKAVELPMLATRYGWAEEEL